MALNFTLNNCLYGAGDARTPLYLNLIMSVLQIAFSYLLIFGVGPLPVLGVTGAALATVLSRAAGFAFAIAMVKSNRLNVRFLPDTSYIPERERAERMLRIGIPSAVQGLFRNGSGVVFVKLVALTVQPTVAVAAYSIGNQVERIVRRTCLSFGTAATTLVGQRLGAGDSEGAQRSGWTSILIGSVSMALFGAPLAFFAGDIMGLFTQDPDIIRVGRVYMERYCWPNPQCIAITAGGEHRGAGDINPHYTTRSSPSGLCDSPLATRWRLDSAMTSTGCGYHSLLSARCKAGSRCANLPRANGAFAVETNQTTGLQPAI